MSLRDVMAEYRRLTILRALDEYGYSANEDVLKTVCNEFSNFATKDLVRADISFLNEHGLVRLEKLQKESGEIWIAHLLTAGQEVAKGRVHPGVARREPG
jgi:hypothetical protein